MNDHSMARRLRHLALLLVAALTVAPEVQAQTARDAFRFTERLPATGARMVGLGGASIGGLADASALFTNPAGLGYVQSSVLSGGLNTFGVSDEAFYNPPGFSSTLDSDVTTTNLGNLAYVYKAPTQRGSLVIGAAYNQVNTFERDMRFRGENSRSTITTSFLPFNNEYSLDADGGVTILNDFAFAGFAAGAVEFYPEFLDEDPNAYPFLEAVEPGTTIEQRGTILEEGRMNEFNVGGAFEASQGVMVGLSANLVFGSYDLLNVFEEVDFLDENRPDQYTVILSDGSLLEGFDFFEYRQTLESDLVGVNLRAGLSGQVTPNVRIGASVETPTYYTVDEFYTTRLETLFDFGGSLVYGDDRDDTFGNGEFEYEITSPWRLGAGVVFEAANVSFLADAEFVDWGQMELEADGDPFVFTDVNEQIQEDYGAVINARVGAEYRMQDLALRAGFAYRPDPLAEAARPVMNDGTELDRSKTFFSAGVGYRFNQQFQIDVGWMQSRFDDVYSAYPEDDLGPRQDAVLLVDEEVVRNQFVLGVKYFF